MADQGESSRDPTDSYDIEMQMTELANELKCELNALNSSNPQAARPCSIIIGKVREPTRNVDNCEYDPEDIAIGPYNYPSPQSRKRRLAMEQEKLRCLREVLNLNGGHRTVGDYLKALAADEESVRNCYAHSFDMKGKQFVQMLLLDGCYILHSLVDLQALAHQENQPSPPCMEKAVTLAVIRDVFYLAENQIPISVLETIGEVAVSNSKVRVIEELKKQALKVMINQKYAQAMVRQAEQQMDPGNLLHLVHMQLKPNVSSPPSTVVADSKPVGRWRSAMYYYFAGVTFKPREPMEVVVDPNPMRCILDVKLNGSGGTLEVPILNIDNETWCLLRNLMQLEQQNRETDVGNYITAYCVFMSQVACTTQDVELLCKRGVIKHSHGNDEEVAKCFADLCKGIMFDPDDAKWNYLRDTFLRLEKRVQNNPLKWMAWLRHKYFRNPWQAIGLLVASIVLVCEVIQAVYSVLANKHG